MAGVGRRLNITVEGKPYFKDLLPLLKEGKLEEFIFKKAERVKEWKNERYAVCLNCGKKKLRLMFEGQSAICSRCKSFNRKDSKRVIREYRKEYIRKDGKDNWCAKQIVYNLKKMGILKRLPCELCGEIKSFAHHKDYNKPWEVIWLCRGHHVEWHKDNKPKYVGE